MLQQLVALSQSGSNSGGAGSADGQQAATRVLRRRRTTLSLSDRVALDHNLALAGVP